MTDTKDLIREIEEHTAAHGGETTATHLLVQAVMALQRQADELAAIGAGGVSGPLLGQPQAMPDLSALTERGAKAWAGMDARALRDGTQALAAQAPQPATSAQGGDWTEATTVTQRIGDVLQLLCGGKRPDDDIIEGWRNTDLDDLRLQEFCVNHGPAWAQGIGLIDLAMIAVEQPTEGVDHEMVRAPQQAAPAECHHRPPCAECAALAKSRRRDEPAPQQEVQEPNNFGAPATCDSPALCSVSRVCAGQFGTKRLCDPAIWTAQPAPSGDAWKDGDTAALVNQLRDAALQYRDTQQLRERIAHIVRPLAERVAPSGDAELLDFICDNDRQRMVEQSCGFWRVYQDEAPLEAEHHLWQSMTSRWYPTAREAIKAARKEGDKP